MYGFIPERVIKMPIITLVTNVKNMCGLIINVIREPIKIRKPRPLLLKRLNPNINNPKPNKIKEPFPNEEDQKWRFGNKNRSSLADKLFHMGLSCTFSFNER